MWVLNALFFPKASRVDTKTMSIAWTSLLTRVYVSLQKLQDVITDIVEESNEVQDSLLQGQSVPDQLDEDDLFGGEVNNWLQ